MKLTKLFAVVLIGIALLMTGLGGLLDMSQSKFQITKQHAWNDGIFLVLVAIALLLL
jgi:hypothetical protein